jgi:hypothetical protein
MLLMVALGACGQLSFSDCQQQQHSNLVLRDLPSH